MVVFEEKLSSDELSEKVYKAYKTLYNSLVKTKFENKSISYNLLGT